MAVSGSKNYSITASTIIAGALRKIGIYDEADAVDGDATSTALISLNLMVKEWVADGIDLFLRTESILFLQPNTSSYNLSTAEITDTIVLETTLSAAEAAAQTVISLTTSTGSTAADRIGIKLDDNTIHWTTIVSVDSATQVTITTSTASAAASGNKVYIYTTKSDRPQKILYAFRRDINNFDTEIALIGENEYQSQSNKSSDGPPVEIWYNPQGNQAVGKLRVWPDNGGKNWDKIHLICQHLPDDFDVVGNSPDFPIEWGNALIWGLAAEIGSEYGLTEREINRNWTIAEVKKQKMLDYDGENASVRFSLDLGR